MIGLDSNVVLRYLAQDDPVQSPRAADLLERQLSRNRPGFLSLVVIAEIAWVLQRSYRLQARELAAAIERLLQAEVLVVESEQAVYTALMWLRLGRGGFADALIAAVAAEAGCTHTLSFDRRALRLPGFRPA
ncbi:MAG TPA: type II toxin-antitoxin system VapC family toxin [Terriglobales bacterium]|nr:type II toxin-antitoxin system VapC family toxin [Terriglobales bacterium]